MKVLLIGGTGVISSAVCERCLKLGYSVYMMNRGKSKKNIDKRINLILADIRKESVNELEIKLKNINFDVVVDFLTYNLEQLKKTLQFINCRQYIFISSATVYTEKKKVDKYKEIDEKNNMLWDYCINKIQCEKYLEEKSKDRKFIYTIVRPYVTYDERRIPNQILLNNYYTIIDRILRGLPIVIFGNNIKCTVISSKVFSIGLVGLFGNKKAFNEDFHITSDISTTWKNIIESLGKHLNREVNFIDVSIDFVKNYKNTSLDLEQIVGDKSRNMIFDNKKIKNAVPIFNNNDKFEDNIDEIINYYLKNKKNCTINYLWNGCIDRLIYDYKNINIDTSKYKFDKLKNKIIYHIGKNFYLYRIKYKFDKLKDKIIYHIKRNFCLYHICCFIKNLKR